MNRTKYFFKKHEKHCNFNGFPLFLRLQKWYNHSMKNAKKYDQKELKKLNKNALCAIILDMQTTVEEKEKTIADKDKTIVDKENRIDILTQEVQLLRAKHFGRKSEIHDRDAEAIRNGQLVIDGVFNEAESLVDATDDEDDQEVVVKEHTRKRRPKGKQELDLSKLRKEENHCRIDEETLQEMFPNGYRELPEEIVREVEYIPAEFYVRETHVHVYCAKDDNSHIVKATAPKKLFGKGLATPSLVAGVMNGKYTNGLPLYRMEQEFQRNQVPFGRQTMANWIITASERYFSLLIDRMAEILLTHHVLHADETPTLVTKDGRKAGSKSYMWCYRSNRFDPHPIILFDYQKTRHTSHPQEFLKKFCGILVTDGYEAYHKLARIRGGEISIAGCWVHLNRKFKDALKGLGKNGKKTVAGSIAAEAVRMIGEIFDLDNQLDLVTPEERLLERQEKLKPLVDQFFKWIKEHRGDVTLKSLTGRAMTYALNQEEFLRVFLNHGDVPMENNAAERAIRPFCIGKKNWIMSDTIHGAKASAMVYSIVETAKANNLKPYEYMKYLLEEIPKHMDDTNLNFLDALLPWSDSLPKKCRKPETVSVSK